MHVVNRPIINAQRMTRPQLGFMRENWQWLLIPPILIALAVALITALTSGDVANTATYSLF